MFFLLHAQLRLIDVVGRYYYRSWVNYRRRHICPAIEPRRKGKVRDVIFTRISRFLPISPLSPMRVAFVRKYETICTIGYFGIRARYFIPN